MNKYNENGERHGPWIRHFASGQLEFKGTYKDGIAVGFCEWYHSDGELCFKGHHDDKGDTYGYFQIHEKEWYYPY